MLYSIRHINIVHIKDKHPSHNAIPQKKKQKQNNYNQVITITILAECLKSVLYDICLIFKNVNVPRLV